MLRFLFLVMTVGSFLLYSCSGGESKEDQFMKEAISIFEDSEKMEEEVIMKMSQLKDELASMDNQISNEDTLNVVRIVEVYDHVERIEREFKEWSSELPSIPGQEHDHDHDHDHDHGPALELLPEDMVNVQKEFKDKITKIKIDLDGAIQMMEDLKKTLASE